MELRARDRTRRDRIDAICLGLPGATSSASGRERTHTTYFVGTKKYAYHLVDHHGDGRVSLQTRAAPGENLRLAASGDRFFLPPYLTHHGWIGLWLDLPKVDLEEVEGLIVASYRLQAPKRLVAELDA